MSVKLLTKYDFICFYLTSCFPHADFNRLRQLAKKLSRKWTKSYAENNWLRYISLYHYRFFYG